MFSIIISEKGGAERKEAFDKNEINVGRVQGNDLMLPKGNVSKHHARLLFRDGRFIVTDLKSTNGTYVNGRKIAQATIVREGDKIYIGDFVLRLDAGQQAGLDAPMPAPGEEESIRTLARNQQQGAPQPPAVTMKAQPQAAPVRPQPVAPPPVAAPQLQRPDSGAVSHFPLERDPDESEPAVAKVPRMASAPPPAMPPPIAMPPAGNARGGTMQLPQSPVAAPAPMAAPAVARAPIAMPPTNVAPAPAPAPAPPPPVAMPAPVPVAAPSPAPMPSPVARVPAPVAAPPPAPAPMPMPPAASAGRAPARESASQAGRRLALVTLVDRIADAVDLRALKASPLVDDALAQQIDRAAREQAAQMRDEGEAPEGVDVEGLVRDAVRELVGLGPIGPLLEDDAVSEIHCVRSNQVLALRDGQLVAGEASFTSEEALYRVIARLAHQSGDPWRQGEIVLERRLSRGAQVLAVCPPASPTHVLVVRKRRRVDMSLEDLASGGGLSRPMAAFLEACLAARVNILVCGPSPVLTSYVLAALAAGGPAGERIVALHENDDINVAHAHMVSLPILDARTRGQEAIHTAVALRPDRLVIGAQNGTVAAAMLEAIAEGTEGVIAAIHAPTLRHGLSRLVAQVLLTRPGTSSEAIREVLATAFDVVVELGASANGHPRVVRIAEIVGVEGHELPIQDIFGLDSAGEHAATGAVPRVAREMAQRGQRLDESTFRPGR